MLFGWTRVGPKAHFGATLAVAVGTLISTFWILASNSWMHTPAGYAIEAGRVVPRDWLEIIFNPSFPYRLVHMTLAAFIETACIVAASGAWHLLRGRDDAAIRKMFGMALGMLLVTTPIQPWWATRTASIRANTSPPKSPPSKACGKPKQAAPRLI